MKTTGRSRATIGLVTIIGLYVAAYLLSTEIYRGQLGANRYRIRIFQNELHRQIFVPLSFLEGLVNLRDGEFSAQTKNHASLPPAE